MKTRKIYKTTKRFLCAGLVSVVVLSSAAGCGSKEAKPSETTDYDELATSNEPFDEDSEAVKEKTDEIEQYIDKYFYFETDSDKREESYYDGIMKGLDDRYSVYYTKEEYEKMMQDDSGTFEGIGATVTKNEDGTISVVNPLEGSPAEKAGLQPNDIIVKVDDMELTTDMELEYVIKHIRGEKGTEVTLEIYREGEKDFLTFKIVRDTIENKTVYYEMLDDNVGYISVAEFIDNTPKLFKEAVDELQKQGAEGLVIDLRSNPGGLVNSAIEMVDYLIDDSETAEGCDTVGLLLQTKDKNGNVLEKYMCTDKHSVDIPMAVLINKNSASSAEIFASCMQDYDKAEIVGTTSYGKGIVQSVIKLKDGSAIKITIAQYFRPSGEVVHEVGVTPDVEVELDESLKNKTDYEYEDDNQLQEAIKTLD